jgi:hypothetical protein
MTEGPVHHEYIFTGEAPQQVWDLLARIGRSAGLEVIRDDVDQEVEQQPDPLIANASDFIDASPYIRQPIKSCTYAWNALVRAYMARAGREDAEPYFPVRFLSHPEDPADWSLDTVYDLDVRSLDTWVQAYEAYIEGQRDKHAAARTFCPEGIAERVMRTYRAFITFRLAQIEPPEA